MESGSRHLWRSIFSFRHPLAQAGLSFVLVVLVGVIFNAEATFFKWGTHRDMLRQISVYGILACGMTIVIISGGIDLSVGSVMALSAVIFSLLSINQSWPGYAAVIVTMAVGLLCGMISGAVVATLRVQPFIATLAMMVFARGLSKFVSSGQKVSTAILQSDGSYRYVDVPRSFDILNARIFHENLATVTLILMLCVVLCWVFLSRTVWGRHFYAIGGNEQAAWYSGIPVNKLKVTAYALSGLFCAVAGICQAAQEQQGDPEAGIGYELNAIAMVVIGGTSLQGGHGSIGLTVLGILIIGLLEKILSINAVGEESRLMLTGFIIILAMFLQKKALKE